MDPITILAAAGEAIGEATIAAGSVAAESTVPLIGGAATVGLETSGVVAASPLVEASLAVEVPSLIEATGPQVADVVASHNIEALANVKLTANTLEESFLNPESESSLFGMQTVTIKKIESSFIEIPEDNTEQIIALEKKYPELANEKTESHVEDTPTVHYMKQNEPVDLLQYKASKEQSTDQTSVETHPQEEAAKNIEEMSADEFAAHIKGKSKEELLALKEKVDQMKKQIDDELEISDEEKKKKISLLEILLLLLVGSITTINDEAGKQVAA